MPNSIAFQSYWHTRYKRDVLLAFIIAVSPFLIYLHLFFGTGSSFLFFGYEYIHGYTTSEVFVWSILKSVIPLLLFITWYFTSSQNWKFFLFPFISLYVYSIFDDTTIGNPAYALVITFILILITAIFLIDVCFFEVRRKKRLLGSIYNLLNNTSKQSSIHKVRSDVKNIFEAKKSTRATFNLNALYAIKYAVKGYFEESVHSVYNQQKAKKKWNIIFGLVLVFSFLLSFLHYLIPDTLQEMDLGFITLNSNGFIDLNTYIWFLMNKIIVILPLTVWFVLCESWWRYSILSPIVLYTYQLWESFQDVKHLDAFGNIRVLPIIISIVLVLFLLSKLIKYQTSLLDIYEYVSNETESILLNMTKENATVDILKSELKSLTENMTKKNASERLQSLQKLRNSLYSELEKSEFNA